MSIKQNTSKPMQKVLLKDYTQCAKCIKFMKIRKCLTDAKLNPSKAVYYCPCCGDRFRRFETGYFTRMTTVYNVAISLRDSSDMPNIQQPFLQDNDVDQINITVCICISSAPVVTIQKRRDNFFFQQGKIKHMVLTFFTSLVSHLR